VAAYRRPRARLLAAGTILFSIVPCHAAHAEGWSALAEQRVLYTDNAFQFSSARRLTLAEDPSQPTNVQVDKPSDVVWEPSVDVRRTSSNRLGKVEVSAKAHGFIFTDHSALNHGNYRIQIKQALSPETSVLLRYRYIPDLFLGPNFERRSGTQSVQDERVTSHIWRAQLERALSDLVSVTMATRFGLRLYNDVFAERDTFFYTLGPNVDYAVMSNLTLSLGYQYERGLADGRGDTRFNDDISYRQHFVAAGGDLRLTQKLSLNLTYAFRRKNFTSDLAGDTHLGRQDTTHQGTAELRYAFSDRTGITLGFQHAQRTSNVAAKDFNDTNTSLGIQYRF
jgi:opacity protein-like surface antigen